MDSNKFLGVKGMHLQKSPHNEIFILGDLNIDLAIPNDPNSKALKQLIKQIGCK